MNKTKAEREAIAIATINAINESKKGRVVKALKDNKGKVRKVYAHIVPVFISETIPQSKILHDPKKGIVVVPHKVAKRLINMGTQNKSKYIPNR